MLRATSITRAPAAKARAKPAAKPARTAAKSTAPPRAQSLGDPKPKNAASARKSKTVANQVTSDLTGRGAAKGKGPAFSSRRAASVKQASVEVDEDALPDDTISKRHLRRAKPSAEALNKAEMEALHLRKQMEDMADEMERDRKPKKKPKNSAPLADRNATEHAGPAPIEDTNAHAVTTGQHKYSTRNTSYQATVEEVLALLEEEGAEDVVVLDVKRKCNWTSYFIVATGKSGKHVEGMTQFIVQRLKEKRQKLLYDMDDSSSDWIALDLGEIVVHLMVAHMRKKYDLEGLWMNRPELSPTEMFRQMLAPDPEDTDEKCLPEDGIDESLTPEEAGLTPEELKEIDEMDDEEDLKRLLRAEREAADALRKKKRGDKSSKGSDM